MTIYVSFEDDPKIKLELLSKDGEVVATMGECVVSQAGPLDHAPVTYAFVPEVKSGETYYLVPARVK